MITEEQREQLFDLLTKKAVYGLDDAEDNQLNDFDRNAVDAEFYSLEMTAAAIGLAAVTKIEPMPDHLRAQILQKAPVKSGFQTDSGNAWSKASDYRDNSEDEKGSWFSWFGGLGWATAVAACLALAINIWFTRFQAPVDSASNQPVTQPQKLTLAQQREQLINSARDIIKASWAAGNVKEIKEISGDIVWSDEKQAGFMRFTGLPKKGAPEACYQLWIFDKVQDKATPIDGGTFEVTQEGEVIVPVDAKIKANGPQMFAVTIERAGGVVVSKREKIAALAKVETQSS